LTLKPDFERSFTMNPHPYVRAYLAGVFFPTLVLPVVFAVLILGRTVIEAQFPIERILVFPLAFIPVLWGLWNLLWLASHERTHLAVGLHGAVLPFLLLPTGATLARSLDVISFGPRSVTWFQAIQVPYALIACGFVAALAGYYLVWKYVVGFLNRVLGLA
jgi:hypothetical protein